MKIKIEFEYNDSSQYKENTVSVTVEGMSLGDLAKYGDFREKIATAYVAMTFPPEIPQNIREKWITYLSGLNTKETDPSVQ